MLNIQILVATILSGGVVSLGLLVTGVQAQSGSLEPPGTAVDGSGDPAATTQTQPSWDQVLPTNERFKLVMGGAAVLDKETGLVWEQTQDSTSGPFEDGRYVWTLARGQCIERAVGGRQGWRLPSVHKLTSLLDPTSFNPALPVGHPFSNVQPSFFWTATSNAFDSTLAWFVNFGNRAVGIQVKTAVRGFVWCVRGAGPLSEY